MSISYGSTVRRHCRPLQTQVDLDKLTYGVVFALHGASQAGKVKTGRCGRVEGVEGRAAVSRPQLRVKD